MRDRDKWTSDITEVEGDDLWALVDRGVKWVADLPSLGLLEDDLHELVVDPFLDEDPRTRHADLSLQANESFK